MSIKEYNKDELIKRLKTDLPKAGFYLALFYLIFFLFGSTYVFAASVTATAFVFSYQKNFSCLKILMLAFSQIFVCCLVCIASYHIAIRLALNLLFPFIWVFLHSSPFNNKGYFVGMFTFVFLQLIPIQFSDSVYLIIIVSISTAILTLVLLFIKLFSKKRKPDFSLIQSGLLSVSKLLNGENSKLPLTDIETTESTLFKMAYDVNNFVHKKSNAKNIYYTFALVFQRATYFFSDELNTKENNSEITKNYRNELAKFSEKISLRFSEKECENLINDGIVLLEKGSDLSGRFAFFYRNYIRLIILALKEFKEKKNIFSSSHIKPVVTVSPIFNDLAQRYINNLNEVNANITAYIQSTEIKKVKYY